MAQAGFQRFLQVVEQRPGGDKARLVVVEAEASQGGDAEMLEQGRLRRRRIKRPIGPLRQGHGRGGLLKAVSEPGRIVLGTNTLRRRQPAEFIREPLPAYVRRMEMPCRKLDPR